MSEKLAETSPADSAKAREAKNPLSPGVKPEEQELGRKREEFRALESELAERELHSANLRAELSAFERRYLHLVGQKYAELDDLKRQIAERLAREQPANDWAQKAAARARAQADTTKSTAGEATGDEPRAFKASPETKRLYREVAKRIHPDLTSDRADRTKRQGLMTEANRAYEQGDELKLSKILAEYEFSPERVEGEGPGAELVRVIRRISQGRSRLAEIEAEIQELVRSDLYQLKSRLDQTFDQGQDILRGMLENVNEQIAQAKKRRAQPELGAREWKPPTNQP